MERFLSLKLNTRGIIAIVDNELNQDYENNFNLRGRMSKLSILKEFWEFLSEKSGIAIIIFLFLFVFYFTK